MTILLSLISPWKTSSRSLRRGLWSGLVRWATPWTASRIWWQNWRSCPRWRTSISTLGWEEEVYPSTYSSVLFIFIIFFFAGSLIHSFCSSFAIYFICSIFVFFDICIYVTCIGCVQEVKKLRAFGHSLICSFTPFVIHFLYYVCVYVCQ